MNLSYYQLVIALLLVCVGFDGFSVADAVETESEKSLRYINDRQVVRIRKGRTDKDKIVTSVSSGTELELLAQKGKYSQVRLKNGKTGWIKTIYLRKNPIARVRLKAANKSLKQALADINQKDKKFASLDKAHQKLNLKYQRLESDFTASQQENIKLQEIAADPIKLTKENKRLSRTTATMEANIQELRAEMSDLRDETNKQWFLNGAGVVLLGVLIGLLLPKLRRQRKSDWSSY